ncbi:MAG: glucose-6-phosphate isomerase [Bacteroidota bacterium]|nr:glucose-6-phosphate isomerase [Bacteroidota bacterium]
MKINTQKVNAFISERELLKIKEDVKAANHSLHSSTGPGNDFLGWLDLPNIEKSVVDDIAQRASDLHEQIEVMVVIGIGGSYLGAKAVIEALSDNFSHLKKNQSSPMVLFAGNNLAEDYLYDLRELLAHKSYGLTVISKSGTTTEPAVAFRILKKDIENKYGKKEAAKRITAVTDAQKGALKTLANQEGYKTYVVPDDVGGRFSVLTPVGLWPIAVAGFDIRALLNGAAAMKKQAGVDIPFENNPAEQYAAYRNVLYNKGFKTEILVNYDSKLNYISEWWKQLYGESEGKDGKGIFPASVNFTADLHSMGQYIQDGRRELFETVISVKNSKNELKVPFEEKNLDNLNYLAGKRIDEINKNAELATVLAHTEGGVPNIQLEINETNEESIGELIYFFEKACGISGYVLGVNPFDQPGVEAYKRNMFALLEKPGFEGEREKLLNG